MEEFGNDKGIKVEKRYRKVYTVRISEEEMQMLGSSLSSYFNLCTHYKIQVPATHAVVLGELLQGFKKICQETRPVIMLKE